MRTFGRRLLMISLYATLWCTLTVAAPLVVVAALIYDRLHDNRGASLRLLALVWTFLLAELVGVLLAQCIWLRSRLGGGDPRLRRDTYALQRGWVRVLLGAILRLFDIDLRVSGPACPRPGPVVLLLRHTSFIDTLLPGSLLACSLGMRLRYILKKELRLDPCLDIVGARLPNYFIDRAGETAREVAAIERLATDLDDDEVVLLYPEGTRFGRTKRERILERLRTRDPERHARFAQLHHVLPPRPAGTLALLRSGYDVVFCAHAGLEGFASLHDLLSGALVGTTIRAWMWRIPAASLPAGEGDRLRWLDDQWAEVDRLVASAHSEHEREPAS